MLRNKVASRQSAQLLGYLTILLISMSCPSAKAGPPPHLMQWIKNPMQPAGNSASMVQPKKAAPIAATKPVAPSPEEKAKAKALAAAKWFQQLDQLRKQYHPTAAQQVILNRPLMQQEERVKEWTNTASKISKNYMVLSGLLKKLPVPAGAQDLKEYRDLTADWYHDAALVYDDMIRPRTPATTIEELQRELDEVKGKSQTLVSMTSSLTSMEQDLRRQYRVASSKQDSLTQFVQEKIN